MDRPLIMGILNLTPDSFSDGGQFANLESALDHVRSMVEAGAGVIDLGGESTRPGALRIPIEQEIERVLPVIRALMSAPWFAQAGVKISIDTMNSETANAALKEGVEIVNDVSGGLADKAMYEVVSKNNCMYVIGHWRGFSDQMDSQTNYTSLVAEVVSELADRVKAAESAGISRERIIIDPGFGFAKNVDQNWQLAAKIDHLKQLGLPILLGASRKRFIAAALNPAKPAEVENASRDLATAVLNGVLAKHHPWGFRVHNVAATRDALAIAQSLEVAARETNEQS